MGIIIMICNSGAKFSSNISFNSNATCYFDITINDAPAGRITFELYSVDVPKTSFNFLYHCAKNYAGSAFHRIIPQFMLQGGDFTNHNGTGGVSAFGTTKFNDENFKYRHTVPGLLSMANAGPNTNGSQFFITTVPCDWLDNKHCVYGKVVDNMALVKTIEACGSNTGSPNKKVRIAGAGVLNNGGCSVDGQAFNF
eukprot:GDKH01009464.1.p1 GENE.GDKH01009464.1~~GDKH01009464.1.p1  ORF type:complete len:196 (+),score=44.77 GDKH01009464.1:1-588(+)